MVILRALERAGITRREHRKYPLREDVFDVDTRERNYWIGVMMADGNVHYRKKSGVMVELPAALQDRTQLLKFRNFLATDKPIYFSSNSGRSRNKGRRQIQGKVVAVSRKIAKALEPFGVVPRKSHTAKVKLLKKDLDFWRGVIDGDGTVRIDKRGDPYLAAHGSKPLMRQFRLFVLTHFPDFRGNVLRCGTIWRVILHGKKRATKMVQLLYENCDVSLDRKQLAADEIIKRFAT